MPIGGVVITTRPKHTDQLVAQLRGYANLEIHGSDDKGNIVAVLEAEDSSAMQRLMDEINSNKQVLSVGLTYLNTEDEAELIASGKQIAMPPGYRKPLRDKP